MNKVLRVLETINLILGASAALLAVYVNPDDSNWIGCTFILLSCVLVCVLNMYILRHAYYIIGFIIGAYVLNRYRKNRYQFNLGHQHILDIIVTLTNYNYNRATRLISYHYNNAMCEED